MKKTYFTLLFIMFSSVLVIAQSEDGNTTYHDIEIAWRTTYEDAVTKSKETQKPILIYFTGSDWCGPCIKLDEELFHTEKFKKFSDNHLVLYQANFPRNKDLVTEENQHKNKELSLKYAQTSFPTMILVDDEGYLLGRKNGTYMAEYYYPFFEEIIRNYK